MCLPDHIQRWVSFGVALFVMLGMGTLYSYSAYSSDLQALLGYSGTQVNIVSSVGDLGLYVGGIPVGIFYDAFGASLTYILASVFLFLGYVLMWSGAVQKISSNAFAMGFYLFIVGFGSVSAYMAGLLTNTKNFTPQHRGKIIAVLVAAYGLSAAIFSQIYQHAFNHDVARFFWVSALILGVVPIFGIFLVKSVPISSQPQAINGSQNDVISVAPTPDQSLVQNSLSPPPTPPPQATSAEFTTLQDSLESPPSNAHNSPIPMPQKPTHSSGKYGDIRGLPVLKSPDFLLLFAIVACCTGVGLTWINIVGTVVKSYKITLIPASGYVIGLSVANAAGRLLFGMLCDLKLLPLPTVYLMAPCLTILLISHFILIFVDNYIYLLVATLLTGLSYGGSFSVMPVIINNYFGDKNYGSNLGLLILAVALGSMTMGAVSGEIYDKIARNQAANPPVAALLSYGSSFISSSSSLSLSERTSDLFNIGGAVRKLASGGSSQICYGLECFRWTYVMTTCVSVVGLIITFILLRREMKFDANSKLNEGFGIRYEHANKKSIDDPLTILEDA